MKKLFIFSALILSMTFASCHKNFECSCVTSTSPSTSMNGGGTAKTNLIYVTKKTAKANCVSSSWTDAGGTSYTKTCTLN